VSNRNSADSTDSSVPLANPPVEVRRSKRRKRTVSAHREGDTIVVSIPARMTKAEEREWIGLMVERIAASERRRRPSDEQLFDRAIELSERYLGGRAQPQSVRWVDNQRARWGSATPVDRSIRISSRLRGAPSYVTDYVLLHELAHLIHGDHGKEFWALLAGYPQLERAKGFLEGVDASANGDLAGAGSDSTGEAAP
jgi:predicted metal-dependent hydrolase